jgi:RNA polymerase sigma-70 factor, ECF subfamily
VTDPNALHTEDAFPERDAPGAEDALQDAAEPDWREIVERVRTGNAAGMEDLYSYFGAGIRFHLYRRFGTQDLEDKVHDIFVMIAEAIHAGEPRDPERLAGYIRTIVRRQIATFIEKAVQTRRKQTGIDPGMLLSDHAADPERKAIERQNMEIAMRVLKSAPQRDREVLVRFYLEEQSAEEICRELDLSDTQFRLIKSRAKARFGKLAQARLRLKLGRVLQR